MLQIHSISQVLLFLWSLAITVIMITLCRNVVRHPSPTAPKSFAGVILVTLLIGALANALFMLGWFR